MAIYKCPICGYEYDEEKMGKKFEELEEEWNCIACGAPKNLFEKVEEKELRKKDELQNIQNIQRTFTKSSIKDDLSYPKEFAKAKSEYEPFMNIIHEMAVSGTSIIEPMGTKLPVISWNDILILGAQLNPSPLMEHDEVKTETVIGKRAKKPMVIESPIYISHMSFGALSKETKVALSKGAAMAKTAMCSGEGGILPEEKSEAYKYIFEYVPNLYSVTDENLQKSDAIEIKIGQGTKPGMGGHLPRY